VSNGFTGANRGFGGGGFGNRGFGGRGWGGRGWGGRGWGWGGWGFGWGLGWGWGWGSPWGFGWWGPGWAWDPYWYDPWWAYPYYGYPAGGYYDYGPPYAPPSDQGDSDYGDYYSYGPPYAAPPDSGDYYGDSSAPVQGPQDQYSYDPGPSTGNVAESMPTVLLYLTDGTVYPATQYWVSGSTVHYVVAYGGESTVPISQVDMQRTINENAKRGVRFNLRPRGYSSPTASAPAAPPTTPAPKAQPVAQLQPAA